jgi:hypothetical protein
MSNVTDRNAPITEKAEIEKIKAVLDLKESKNIRTTRSMGEYADEIKRRAHNGTGTNVTKKDDVEPER